MFISWFRRLFVRSTETDPESPPVDPESRSAVDRPVGPEATSSEQRLDPSARSRSDGGAADTDVAEDPVNSRSPAEAFAELTSMIASARRDVAQVADYVRGSAMRLQRDSDESFRDGADAAIRALIRIHELIFKSAEAGERTKTGTPAGTVGLLGDAVEGELRALSVTIIMPEIDVAPDLRSVVAIAHSPLSRLRARRDGAVAKVITPGYILELPSGPRTLKKAEVVIYRRQINEPVTHQDQPDGSVPHDSAQSLPDDADSRALTPTPEPRAEDAPDH
jgi:hypothetical protein